MSRTNDLKELIINYERRLQKLQEQQASFGSLHAPPHILIEIEDTQAEIQKLRQELRNLERSSITEPTLEHYVYYLRRAAGDNDQAVQKRRAAFAEELRGLLVHLERLSGQTTPHWDWPQESEDRHISQRIMRTDWLDNLATGRSYFVEARTYGDLYWLQIGYYQSGQAGSDIFTSLRDEAWRPAALDHLLGISTYLCGIVAEEMDQLAAQAMKAYAGDISNGVVATHLANDCGQLYGISRYPYVIVLFYPQECEREIGQTILNDVALRLELYKHKTDRQLAWCEGVFQLLSEQEHLLSDLLRQVRQAPAHLEHLQSLIPLYVAFTGNVGMLAERQTTIEINLDNLDAVRQDLKTPVKDDLIGTIRDHLRQRQKQLTADLTFVNQTRQQAETVIGALKVEVALEQLVDFQAMPVKTTPFESTTWPGASPMIESEMEGFIAPQKPPQPVTYPQINAPPSISLTGDEKMLLRQIYRSFGQVLVEKEFGGGYSSARVLLTRPVRTDGISIAPKVIKLGSVSELRRECDNYKRYVGPFLPHSTARVEWENYCQQNGQAGLTYTFMSGGSLGQAVDFEEYYRRTAPQMIERIVRTLNNLLYQELGERWYSQATPLACFFAAEYGPRMIEHLQLRLRPESLDTLWLVDHPPSTTSKHRSLTVEEIPRIYETIQPGTWVTIEGMRVRWIKRGEVRLEDIEGQGIVVGVKIPPGSNFPHPLELGNVVGVRGEVVYNQRGRMQQIIAKAWPELPFEADGEAIKLPGMPAVYPNPLENYSQVLYKILTGKQSYVHGDLHLHNVLVDEWGKGWLIDFALVKKQHNIFDFIKLETSLRMMVLAKGDLTFSLADYVRFEEALVAATLNDDRIKPPNNFHLQTAYEVILAIRRIARNYMMRETSFLSEYFPALFLYCLSVIKYYREDVPQPTRLAFATASILMPYLLEEQ